ncbi:MAG: TlpA disulfide reductase family protein [Bacteroidota bacterium]
MRVSILMISGVLLLSTVVSAKTVVEGISEVSSFELLMYDNPIERNLKKLVQVETDENGRFYIDLSFTRQEVVIFKNKDFSRELSVYPETSYIVRLDNRLNIKEVIADRPEINQIFSVENDLNNLKTKYLQRNKSAYYNDLFKYLKELLISSGNKDPQYKVINSKAVTYAVANLKANSKKGFLEIEPYYLDKIDFSFNGVQAINIIYALELQFKFFKTNKKVDYIDFIEKEVNTIAENKPKAILDLILTSQALGRKYADQNKLFGRVEAIISVNASNALGDLGRSINDLHKSTIIGTQLQEFTFTDLQNNDISTKAFEGKFLLIDFWATWCGPCIKSMKKLPEVRRIYKDRLNILCLSIDYDIDKMRRFAKKSGYYEELIFAYSKENDRMDSYFNRRAIPLYFLVGPDGTVLGKAVSDPFPLIDQYLATNSE